MTYTFTLDHTSGDLMIAELGSCFSPIERHDLRISLIYVGPEVLEALRQHRDVFDETRRDDLYWSDGSHVRGTLWSATVLEPSQPTNPWVVHLVANDDEVPLLADRPLQRPVPPPELPPVTTTVWDRLDDS